ncbi:MAG: hypothetical protein IKA97_00315, partial [Clostridia bacterium]|nr:hypothetical protein [Clostridia bacterium]
LDFGVEYVEDKAALEPFIGKAIAEHVAKLTGDEPIEYLKELISVIHIGDLACLVPVFGGSEGAWTLNDEILTLIISDVFDVTVGDILAWLESDDVVMAIAKGIFDERTVEEYLVDANVTFTEDKKALAPFVRNNTIVELIEGFMGDEPVEYLKGLVKEIYVGDILGLVMPLVSNDDHSEWTLNGNVVGKEYLLTLFNVQLSTIFELVESGDIKQFVQDLFGERTFGDYFSDFAEYGVEILTDSAALAGLRATKVTQFIIYIIEQDWDSLKAIIGDVHVGDIACLAKNIFGGEKDNWTFNGEEVKLITNDIFNVTVGNILAWVDGEGDMVDEIVADVFGENNLEYYLEEFVEKITEVNVLFPVTKKFTIAEHVAELKKDAMAHLKAIISLIHVGDIASLVPSIEGSEGSWTVGEKEYKLVNDIFDVTGGEVLAWVDGEGDMIEEIVADVFKTRKLREYLEDFEVEYVKDKTFLKPVLDNYTIAEHVSAFRDDAKAHIIDMITDLHIGDLLCLAPMFGGTVDHWTANDKEIPWLIIQDIFN